MKHEHNAFHTYHEGLWDLRDWVIEWDRARKALAKAHKECDHSKAAGKKIYHAGRRAYLAQKYMVKAARKK